MPSSARCIRTSIDDVDAIVAEAAGAEVVVHALNPVYTHWATELMPMARKGMDIAERLDARFALPGNVYNYGAGMPATLAADTPHRPTTRKGRLRVELESELRRRAPRLRSLVLRGGDYFGAGAGNWFDLVMLKSISRGKLVYPGPTTVAHAWAYLPDMTKALVGLCECTGQPPFADIPFQGTTLTGDEMLTAIERAARGLGVGGERPFRYGSVPWALIRTLGVVVPMWREIAEMRYLWETPHGLDGSTLARWLPAFRPTPLDAALRASLVALDLAPSPHD